MVNISDGGVDDPMDSLEMRWLQEALKEGLTIEGWMASCNGTDWDYYGAELYRTKDDAIRVAPPWLESLSDDKWWPGDPFWVGQLCTGSYFDEKINKFFGHWIVDEIEKVCPAPLPKLLPKEEEEDEEEEEDGWMEKRRWKCPACNETVTIVLMDEQLVEESADYCSKCSKVEHLAVGQFVRVTADNDQYTGRFGILGYPGQYSIDVGDINGIHALGPYNGKYEVHFPEGRIIETLVSKPTFSTDLATLKYFPHDHEQRQQLAEAMWSYPSLKPEEFEIVNKLPELEAE